jgi:hypothetical protein
MRTRVRIGGRLLKPGAHMYLTESFYQKNKDEIDAYVKANRIKVTGIAAATPPPVEKPKEVLPVNKPVVKKTAPKKTASKKAAPPKVEKKPAPKKEPAKKAAPPKEARKPKPIVMTSIPDRPKRTIRHKKKPVEGE